MYLVIANLHTELVEYFNAIKDLTNPVYISVFTTAFITALLYLILKYWVLPQQKNHEYERNALELKNMRLMALFADLDPDPIIRIDSSGKIIFLNPAALSYSQFLGSNINDVIPEIKIDPDLCIESDQSVVSYITHNKKHFAVQTSGIKYLGIAQIYLHDITDLKLYQGKLELARNEMIDFAKHLQNTIEEDRQRISRELHDGIGQNLVLAQLICQKLVLKFPEAEKLEETQKLNSILYDTTKEVKGIAYSLKPRLLEEAGLIPAISDLVETIRKQSGIKGSFISKDLSLKIVPEVETAIFRIAQEALNNMVKYSDAKEFLVNISETNSRLKLIISDDGKGFECSIPNPDGGLGIRNMRERTEAFKGTFRITSGLEEGTIIVAEFPIN